MELGNKIKKLRHKSGLTQEQLAKRLGISPQSVSKWETAVTMPDITTLPALAGEFGVSIDELFDLTTEEKLHRIEKRIDVEEELAADIFKEYEEFLENQLSEYGNRPRILSLLGRLYHHRMESDGRRVRKYAREAIFLQPEKKDCQWLLQMAEGQYTWDWNVANHASIIDFYKEVIEKDAGGAENAVALLLSVGQSDRHHRTQEAEEYLKRFQTLPAHNPVMVPIYQAHIALAEYDEKAADGIIEEAGKTYPDDWTFLFEAAQYYARKCEYEKAVEFYERSWQKEESQKPRFTDALEGIAKIYEILGNYEKAAAAYDRIVENLKSEWGFSSDDKSVLHAEREAVRLRKKHCTI